MDKKRIGVYYNVSDSWIGGKYYLDGILNTLRQDEKNDIIYLKPSFIMRCIGKVFGKTSFLYRTGYRFINSRMKLDVVFPFDRNTFCGEKNISWIPDFQENYYPEFFDISEISKRLDNQAHVAYSNDWLILSSESAKKDFERLFPKYTCKLEVLPFISSLCNKKIKNSSNILQKYNISEPFFICSNQLWQHKNHKLVIEAVRKLKNKGKHILCLFTGKEEDFRNPNFPNELKKIVKVQNLENEIRFLGFIPREDQVLLMKEAFAVVQPSLFEGWNTTIEDAKYLKKLIFASSIEVHKEQLGKQGCFFNVDDSELLSELLFKFYENNNCVVDYKYEETIEKYKEKICSIFS